MNANEQLEQCKAGNSQALNHLYVETKPKLLGICRQFTKEDGVAEDLLHDAFIVIFTSLDHLKDSSKLEAWMTSIVHNVGYQYQKRLEKEQAALQQMASEARGQASEPSLSHTINPVDSLTPDYDQLQILVSQLPQGYQQVFRLSVFEGLSHQEISQLLGISPHTSSSQLSHARRMLQALVKQSWVLILLLIAIPTAIWQLFRKPTPAPQLPTAQRRAPDPQPKPVVETPHDQPYYADAHPKPVRPPVTYQTEAVVTPDSIPYYHIKTPADSLAGVAQAMNQNDSLKEKESDLSVPVSSFEEFDYQALVQPKPSASWDIRLTYHGQIGRSDDYLAAATIGQGSFNALSNTSIPTDRGFNNWIDYNYYLNYSPLVTRDAETRSLMNIAAKNTTASSVFMEARHEHQLPVTIQLMLNRQLSPRLSIETGLSYTRLSSTIKTGSSQAYVQERQRLHYLGIPIHLGWQWYGRAHFSLYSSAGAMLELPIRSTSDINHIDNGISTFQKEESLSVPCQFSTTFGLGLQYDLTPHFGVYLEPSLQYFFDDGSGIKTYRTEHPLEITLPLGIRFRW